MESYVQHGVEAIGQLAGSLEAQIQAITAPRRRDHRAVRAALSTSRCAMLGEQLQLMYERMAIDTTRSHHESITSIAERTEERTRAVGRVPRRS